jgi:glycine/D-amino acid oxidase-like deaminating enzyme
MWISTCHFRSGALLAPATAQLLADSIISGTLDERLAAFDPAQQA